MIKRFMVLPIKKYIRYYKYETLDITECDILAVKNKLN